MISVIVWRKECQGISLIYSSEARFCAEFRGHSPVADAVCAQRFRKKPDPSRRQHVQSALLLAEARLRLDQMRCYRASQLGAHKHGGGVLV